MCKRSFAMAWTAALAALACGSAAAQPTPEAGRLDAGGAWIYIVTAIVLTAIAGTVSFMSPRRGHQD
ncbi:MAG: hypothetical protein AAF288_03090 [Planctomycetota bacterium]